LLTGQKDVGQSISDLFFTVTGASITGASLSSSSGQEITVAGNKTFTLGSTVSTGWALTTPSPTGTVLLNGLAGAANTPAHTIIGPPTGTTYPNANGSIAGNGPHNPFLNQTAMFTIATGTTNSVVVTGATFSFGTTAGDNVTGGPGGGGPGTVPEPSTLAIAGLGALGFIGFGVRRRLKK